VWVSLKHVYRLGIKELYSLRSDLVMVVLILYTFSYAIYTPAKHAQTELRNASVAIVDHDHSQLSQRIRDALLPPYFQEPAQISAQQVDRAMDAGRYTFVLDVPPDFEADLLAGQHPALQVNVDATAMTQAGHGAHYIQRIVAREVAAVAQGQGVDTGEPVQLVARARFNPNLESRWFLAVMQLVNMITLMAVILTGAALIREREHGTIEHLLVMPLRPAEIMLAKIWANGLIIVIAAMLSLLVLVQGILGVPIAGSVVLFAAGTAVYLFSVTALGIFLATLARTMPQFGLLAFPVFMVMNLLSGGTTPLDSMPPLLQYVMQLAPSTHFVDFAQGILYRGAGLDILWPQLAAIALIGAVLFAAALHRFRRTVTSSG
jgi:ABC-2 type transport system permease protein